MNQVIRRGLRDIVVDEVPDPLVAPHHVLIRPHYSLISSGTETASIHQNGVLRDLAENPSHVRMVWDTMKAIGPLRTASEVRAKFSEYTVLGYSGAGVVADRHPTVSDVEIGERVAYGGESTGHGEIVHAGRNLLVRVPDTVPFEHACFTTLGSIALNAVRIAEVRLGDTVAVIGLGIVGQLIAQLARLQGGVVIGIDLKPERIELARRLGAAFGIEGAESLRDAVSAVTGGRGADCVIVAAAAKSSAPARQAVEICRDRGRLVVVGAVELNFPWQQMYLKEIQLFMSRAYGPGSYDPAYEKEGRDYPVSYVRWTENRNMEHFVRLLADGAVQVAPLVTHRFALVDAPAAYATILNPSGSSLAVLLRFPAADVPASAPVWQPRRRVEVAVAGPRRPGELAVAVTGAGNIARWEHLPSITAIPGVTLRAIHSASGARGKSYARRFGATYCCSDYEEILKDPEVDVVLILSRNQHHFRQARQALQAGKHAFVEKPMALTAEECRTLWETERETGRRITVGFNRRFAPFYLAQRRALAGRSGPAVLNCRVSSPGITTSHSLSDPANGGAILGEACHFVDLMYWLLGSEPIEVFAYCVPADGAAPADWTNMVASFRFADGSVGNLTYCTIGGRHGGERIEAFAHGLSTSLEDFKRLSLQRRVRHTQSMWWPDKGHAAQLQAYVASLRAGAPPAVTAVDGARATLGCLRMLDSARMLRPAAIDLGGLLGTS